MNSLAQWMLRLRLPLGILLAVATLLALWGMSHSQFDDQPRAFFRGNQFEFELLESVFAQFGSDENDCALLVEAEDLFAPASLQAFRQLVTEIQAVPGVAHVISLADPAITLPSDPSTSLLADPSAVSPNQLRERSLSHPLVGGQLLNSDGTATLILANIAGDNLAIADIKPVTDRLKAIARSASQQGPLQVHLSGLPAIRADIFTAVQSDSRTFMVLGAVLATLMALLLFRRLSLTFIASISSMVGCVWTLGILAWLGVKVNIITTVLPVLVLVIGFTDAVHLVVDIRHSRRLGHSPRESARRVVAHLGVACFLTSLTTAVGFASLAVTQVEIIRRFGLTCALGAGFTFVAVITVAPLLASTRLTARLPLAADEGRWRRRVAGLATASARFSVRHRWAIAIGSVVLTLTLLVVAAQLRPDSQLRESLPRQSESFQTLQKIDRDFGGILATFVVVQWPDGKQWHDPQVMQAIQRAQDICQAEPDLQRPVSVLTLQQARPEWVSLERAAYRLSGKPLPLPENIRELVSRYLRPDLRRTLIRCRIRDYGTRKHRETVDDLRREFEQLRRDLPGYEFHLTGSSVVGALAVNQMIVDLARSLGLAAVVIFGVMTLVFRSIRLGLISLIPNTLPLAVTAAWLVLIGEPLRLTSVIVFSICLGIAVDDTIHFLVRFRRELREVGDVTEAIERTYLAVSSALITSTSVLVTGFLSVMISQMPHNRLFASLACLAIITALLGDLLILPALLACFCKPPPRGNPQPATINLRD